VTKTGIAAQPGVADWDRRHKVTQFAPWSDVQFGQSLAVKLKPWGQALVEAERTPLIVAGERGGKRVVWCGFLLRETDLPLKITFPIFITNTLRWLSAPRGASAAAEGAPRRAGDTVPLDAPPGVQEIAVTAPDKSTRRIPVSTPPALYSGADQVGVYTAVAGFGKSQWKQTFAVSLLNKAESDLQPRDALQIGDATSKNKTIAAETRARANRELWGYLALAALGLLGLEWWVYHRGV
jgi:Ca-activated chloride channel family protein